MAGPVFRTVLTPSTIVQARFLLRPSRDLNEIVLGILARAARLYDVKVCAFVFLSNHAHLLLQPADAEQLALFMGYLTATGQFLFTR